MTLSPKKLAGATAAWLRDWSVPRQIAGQDAYSTAAESEWSRSLRPRLEDADKVGTSICPVLRGRLRAARLCAGKRHHPYRGRPAQPDQPGHAVPEGRRDDRLD